MMRKLLRHWLLVLLALILIAPATRSKVQAQTQSTLDIELNGLVKTKNGCRVDFVMRNGLAKAIEALSLEIVLFKKDGGISRILAIKAGELPMGKTRVKQFRLRNCENIGRILVNDITVCKGGKLTPKNCLKALKVGNRTGIEFGL